MKAVPYSPYNKTYKYICLQNQVAHSKNKRNVSSSIGSNVSFLNSTNTQQKMLTTNNLSKNSVSIYQPQYISLKQKPRVIHMNKPYDSKIKKKVQKQNDRIRKKLSQTKCRILTKKETLFEYSKSKIYKDIACRYNESKRKDLIYFPYQDSLLFQKMYTQPQSTRSYCRPNSSKPERNYSTKCERPNSSKPQRLCKPKSSQKKPSH